MTKSILIASIETPSLIAAPSVTVVDRERL
jgi:hypothetical protein